MKIIQKVTITLTLVCGFQVFAQNSENSEEIAELNQEAVIQLANEFSLDPNFEVNVDESGAAEVKKRTQKSELKNDPKMAREDTNFQRILEVNIGFLGYSHISTRNFPSAGPQTKTISGNTGAFPAVLVFHPQLGFRPPVKYLKRLLVGGEFRTHVLDSRYFYSAPDRDAVSSIPYNQRDHYMGSLYNTSLFADWDVLILRPTYVGQVAISFGAYVGQNVFHDSTYKTKGIYREFDAGDEQTLRETERGFSIKWRGVSDGKIPTQLFFLGRRSTKGNFSAVMGIGLSFGKPMWIKKIIEK